MLRNTRCNTALVLYFEWRVPFPDRWTPEIIPAGVKASETPEIPAGVKASETPEIPAGVKASETS